MSKTTTISKEVGNTFLVNSGSVYSGEVGNCIEVIKSKQHGVMLKLALVNDITWFKKSELTEV